MAAWVLRFILVVLVLRALWRMIAAVAEGMQQPRVPPPPPSVGLVRDPVCGTFVVPGRALATGAGEDRQFFCSERCRQAWVVR